MDGLPRDSQRVIQQSSHHSKSGGMISKDLPPPPPSTSQVAKRTSVLCKLTRTSLSERGMSGMWPSGQRACEPVVRLVLLPEPDNKGLLVRPSPPLGSLWSRNFFLRSYDSDLLVGQLGTTLVQTYQLSRCPRVLIFWFVTSY